MSKEVLEALFREIPRLVAKPFHIEKFCFEKQIDFINDESPFKTAVCSRRSGKTVACAADLIRAALKDPDRVCLYITLSRKNAKKLVWKELKKINAEFKLMAHEDNQELSMTFPNGSTIYCSGAKDASEIEKFRGLAITLCYIDECQSFRPYIEELIDDVISAALFDYNGKLCLIGTPGPVPAGYFYKASQSANWSHHHWTMFENPHISAKSGKPVQELIQRELDRRGVQIDNPSIQREMFGRWVIDTDSLVFKYSAEINHFDTLPVNAGRWEYVMGVDVGHDDADAVVVLAWNEYVKTVYLVDEIVTKKQGITELAQQMQELIDKYKIYNIVMDTGGLGKKIAKELQTRFSLPVRAADKARKHEFIELMNDASRRGAFKANKASVFAQDSMLVEWDLDKETPDKKVVSDRYHSDVCDAALYAFRECLHWLSGPEPEVHAYQSDKWFKKQHIIDG